MIRKECDTCKDEKDIIYFYFDYKNDDNRGSSCTKCVNHRKKMDKKKKQKANKKDPRRSPIKQELVLYKRISATKTIQKVYNPDNTPLFMQFNHLIYKHVKKKYSLSFSKLNLLMFVFPLAPFPRKDFLTCREIMGYNEIGLMKYFINNDFIYIWSKPMKNDRVPILYDLTTKGKSLIKDIHNWALGREKIPEVNEECALDLLARLRGIKNI